MSIDHGQGVVAASIARWPSRLEDVLFGTNNADEIVALLRSFAGETLATDIRTVTFYRRGVGAVFGIILTDGRRVVVKVHRPELNPLGIEGCRAVQRRLAEQGLPAPMPIGDVVPLAHGVAAAEDMIDIGTTADAHRPNVRSVLAFGLHAFVEAAAPMVGEVDLAAAFPLGLGSDQLWSTPHDLRFDFSLAGAAWVDEVASDAKRRLHASTHPKIVGHQDWRVENVRLDGSAIVAIFDWDSISISTEAALVGATSTGFVSDWNDESNDPYPSLGEMGGFVSAYEQARGSPFTATELSELRAAQIYHLAYKARCEHSDAMLGLFPADPDRGWSALLGQLVSSTGTP
jgi:Phosphotransferase enzyme family